MDSLALVEVIQKASVETKRKPQDIIRMSGLNPTNWNNWQKKKFTPHKKGVDAVLATIEMLKQGRTVPMPVSNRAKVQKLLEKKRAERTELDAMIKALELVAKTI